MVESQLATPGISIIDIGAIQGIDATYQVLIEKSGLLCINDTSDRGKL